MKKSILIGSFLVIFLLTASIASAHVRFGFVFPPVVIGPPVVSFYSPANYPYTYGYYGPGYYGYRVWVPGYWHRTWTSYGWQRVWVSGHWAYRR